MEQSLPQNQSISPLPPTSSNSKNWVIPTAIILVLLVGGYFVLAKTQNFWPFSSRVAVESGQTPTSTLTPQTPDLSSQDKFYVQTWSDTPQNNPNLEVYEINKETANKIFARSSSQTGAVLGVTSQGILIIESVSGLPNKLSLYNTQTQMSLSLVALATGHTFVGSLSPDGKQVVFADHCGIGCNVKQGEATNFIKSINLNTKEIKTIYTDSATDFNFFNIPSDWANNETAMLTPGIEVGEGPQYFRKVIALNVQSNQAKELTLDQSARSISVNPNGAGVVFTTFTYDATKKTHSSTLVLKSLDGTAKTLQNSNQLEYESSVWLDNENIVVLVKNIQSVSEDCAYDVCREGKRAIQIINTKTGTIQNLTLSVEPVSITFGSKQNVYYLSSMEAPSTYLKSTNLLHRYNLTTGEDKVVFQSPRFVNLISK